jgi:Ca2+/Na+ antiporter
MIYNPKLNFFLFGVFVAALSSSFVSIPSFMFLSFILFIYLTIVVSLYFKKQKEKKIPRLQFRKTKEQKQLAKIKKKRLQQAKKRHEMINNQFVYIQNVWSLSRDQQKTFVAFIEKRAYTDLYTKMTASLLPQLIKMIDLCIEQNKKGCKRNISRRINELVTIMKEEIKRKKSKEIDDFETIIKVYDHLIDELK